MFYRTVLLVTSSYADNVNVRRVSGLASLMLVFGAAQVVMSEPVFVLDLLFMLGAAVSFGLVALHRPVETHSSAKPRSLSIFSRLPQLPAWRQVFSPMAKNVQAHR